jgi:hypothetical protein
MSTLIGDVLWAWLVATLLSGLPSTLHALATGADAWEATRAAGAMLIASDSPLPRLVAAAAIVHGAVSLLWASIATLVLPRRGTVLAALALAAAIAVLDLRVIAPILFPEVARLPFWPQFADHLMWGACVGVTLRCRWRKKDHRTPSEVRA